MSAIELLRELVLLNYPRQPTVVYIPSDLRRRILKLIQEQEA